MTLRSRLAAQRFRPEFWACLINRSFLSRYYLFQALKKFAPQAQGRLLDFGCGAKPYRSLFDVDAYVGVDVAVSGHDHSQEEIDVYYDGKTLPFPDQSFDFVLSSEVLEHVFNLEEILHEIRRVCKPQAKLLLTVPFAFPEHEVPYDFARYTRFALDALLRKHGFRLITLEGTTSFMTSLCQLLIEGSARGIMRLPRAARLLFQLLWAFPLSLLGILFNRSGRGQSSYPLNYILLAEKTPE